MALRLGEFKRKPPTNSKQEILDYLNWIVGTDFLEKGLLFDAAREGPGEGYILEIGCDLGQSLLALATGSKLADREKVFSIDIDIGREDVFWQRDARVQSGAFRWRRLLENIILADVADWVILVAADSMEFHKYLDIELRLLYIDGNHAYEYTCNDIVNYGKMLIPGGLIFVHDYWSDRSRDVGVYDAVNELIRDSEEYVNFRVVGILACAVKKRVV